ncbi:nuclear transport factor 2 family protein [Streptococcus gallolyticus]|uniref:nuclear transport factor 2 family protein n=1 Tax=Streptococcus gallolyticus TaxID=315405 RepID=UPI001F44C200|nr:nuclear transport factor 2 family protein [Streptococcus gallolyticus]MCF1633519.1 nuclear transport factor 2 family protein [Streptococcus gallolyticus]MCQ9216905.1 nuclear transport factor 2 family protein [Streptococcus gallolyticus]
MTEEILKQLYRQVNDAMVAKDTKKLAELLEPDTVLIHMTGYVQPVTEWLEQIETGDMIYYSWQEDAIKNIKINGNTASLVGQSRVKARVWGSGPATWRLQIKMDFEKIDGDWKIIKQSASTY